MEDVLGSCMESSFWQTRILPLTFPSLACLLFFSYLFTENKCCSSSSCHPPVISAWGLSKVINEFCWLFSENRAHVFRSRLRAGTPHPRGLYKVVTWGAAPTPLVGVAGSSGTALTWIFTASLLPTGLRTAWVLSGLVSRRFCSSLLATWRICCAGCLKGPAGGQQLWFCPGRRFCVCLHQVLAEQQPSK